MGLFDDIFDGGGDVLKKVGGAVKDTADLLVDEEAWGNVLSGDASWSDIANVALDASMLIPGAGLAGGVARMGTRGAAKLAAREAAEKAAQRTVSKTATRSPLNNAARSKVDDLLNLKTRGATAREGLKVGTEREVVDKLAEQAVRRSASRTPGALGNQVNRIASKQGRGIGTKVGFGQTRRRALRNAMLTGGANAFQGAYDNGFLKNLLPDGGDDTGKRGADDMLDAVGRSGAGAGTIYIVGSNGEQVPMPGAFADALAQFMQQNGVAEGTQVISNR